MAKKTFILSMILITFLTGCGFNNENKAQYAEIYLNGDFLELYGESVPEVRGTYAYITDDDIPELLVSDGDYEAARVSIFTIEDDQIKCIGTFGSPCGTLHYCEKASYVESEYGNQGSFYIIYTSLDGGVDVTGDVFVLQRMDSPTKYYADYYPDGLNGDNSFDYLMYSVPAEYEVSKEEYTKRCGELKNNRNGEWKTAEYETMVELGELIGGKNED